MFMSNKQSAVNNKIKPKVVLFLSLQPYFDIKQPYFDNFKPYIDIKNSNVIKLQKNRFINQWFIVSYNHNLTNCFIFKLVYT